MVIPQAQEGRMVPRSGSFDPPTDTGPGAMPPSSVVSVIEVPILSDAVVAMLLRYPYDDDEEATFWLLLLLSARFEVLHGPMLSSFEDMQDSHRCLNEVNDTLRAFYAAKIRPHSFGRTAAIWDLSVRSAFDAI
jgi:hypothetical protein